ncbi:MAG: hypothetical protein R2792_03700 [Saprospiraceae bacterium]
MYLPGNLLNCEENYIFESGTFVKTKETTYFYNEDYEKVKAIERDVRTGERYIKYLIEL